MHITYQRHDGNAHPQGFGRGCATRLRKGVKRDIDIQVPVQVAARRVAVGNDRNAVACYAVSLEFLEDVFLGDGQCEIRMVEDQARRGSLLENPAPGGNRRAVELVAVVEAAEGDVPVALAGRRRVIAGGRKIAEGNEAV